MYRIWWSKLIFQSKKSNFISRLEFFDIGDHKEKLPVRSVFPVDLSVSMLKHIIDPKLAHLCDLALTLNESMIYVI
jgi:hypothetical protein